MSIAIVCDQHEPSTIRLGLQEIMPVTVTSLEPIGLLDYFWTAFDNHTITLERKEVHDFAGRVSDLELQLKKCIEEKMADEILLLIEGIMEPVDGSTILYRKKMDGSIYYRDRLAGFPYKYYMGFIYRLDKLGITTFWTASEKGTIEALTEFVKCSNDATFTTFNRYIRTKPDIPTLDPQVNTLIQLGLGEMRSKNLIKVFGTSWKVLHAKRKELLAVDGIGEKTINILFKKLGRDK